MTNTPLNRSSVCVHGKGILMIYTILAAPSRDMPGSSLYGIAAAKLTGLANIRQRLLRESVRGVTYCYDEVLYLRNLLAMGQVGPDFLREIFDEIVCAETQPIAAVAGLLSSRHPISPRHKR